jgi:hypothetical protein
LQLEYSIRARQQQPAPQITGRIETREKACIAAMIGAQRLSGISDLLVGEDDEGGAARLQELVDPRERCAKIVKIIEHVNREDQIEAARSVRRCDCGIRQERCADRSAKL